MRGYPDFNFPAFRDAAAQLRALGHEVFSPAERDERGGFRADGLDGSRAALGDFDLRRALAGDLDWVCREAELVVTLPGSADSLGAAAEIAAARALDIPVASLDIFLEGNQ